PASVVNWVVPASIHSTYARKPTSTARGGPTRRRRQRNAANLLWTYRPLRAGRERQRASDRHADAVSGKPRKWLSIKWEKASRDRSRPNHAPRLPILPRPEAHVRTLPHQRPGRADEGQQAGAVERRAAKLPLGFQGGDAVDLRHGFPSLCFANG